MRPDWPALIEALEDEAHREEVWAAFRFEVERLARRLAPETPFVGPADLAQDVMLRLQDPDKRRLLRATRRPGGYLVVLLRNAARDALAREKRERSAWEVALWRRVTAQAPEDDPLDRVTVAALVAALRPEDRELVRLRYAEDLPIERIAERMGLTRSAVSVRLVRLIARLREAAAGTGDREPGL